MTNKHLAELRRNLSDIIVDTALRTKSTKLEPGQVVFPQKLVDEGHRILGKHHAGLDKAMDLFATALAQQDWGSRLDEFAIVNGIWSQASEVGTKAQALKVRGDLLKRQAYLTKEDPPQEEKR